MLCFDELVPCVPTVVDNSSNWAVCGRSSGLVAMPLTERAMHKLHLEVLPLFAGYLPLPDVHLSKYLSESETGAKLAAHTDYVYSVTTVVM